MENINEQAIKAYKTFWDTWGSRDANTVSNLMLLIHPDFNGIGSNTNEVWKTKNELSIQLEEEINQVSEPYAIKLNWIESSKISEKSVLVFGELSVTVRINTKVIILEKVRSSFIFKLHKNALKIKHWHCSLPDVSTIGEVLPGSQEPKKYEEVSVFFCDFVNFTQIVADLPPKEMVAELSDIFQHFDEIMATEQLEKIQVYGDGYLAVCGLPEYIPAHAINCVKAGKKIFSYLKERNKTSKFQWDARIGIHTGPLVAGVIGERKFSFNIFGDTVNTAARIETASQPNRINVSQTTYDLIKETFVCEHRGKIEVKGKGEIEMYFVE